MTSLDRVASASLNLQVLEVSLAALLREGKTETGRDRKDTEHC